MREILPAIIPETLDDIAEALSLVPDARAAQIDIVDGSFAEGVTWAPQEGDLLPDDDRISYEAHLMVQDPAAFVPNLTLSGVRKFLAHIESFTDAEDAEAFVRNIKKDGGEAGIALLIDTPLRDVTELIERGVISWVQLMSIADIGKHGFPFDDRALDRVREMRLQFPDLIIEVDGGITLAHTRALFRAGANRLAVGSAILSATDPADAFEEFAREAGAHAE